MHSVVRCLVHCKGRARLRNRDTGTACLRIVRIGRKAPAGIPIGAHQVRCHLIDRIVVEKITRNPDLLVVLVGAGFDSRAFRLAGGPERLSRRDAALWGVEAGVTPPFVTVVIDCCSAKITTPRLMARTPLESHSRLAKLMAIS